MSVIDTAKTVYELAKKGATIELQEQLVQLREQALALQEENINLKAEVTQLKDAAALQTQLEFDGTAYWRALSEQEREGPYCQRCYDVERNLVRLQSHYYVYESRRRYSWQCRACDKSFEDKTR